MALQELLQMSRALGDPSARLAILAEGNTSAAAGGGSFWIKASGRSLRDCDARDFIRVASEPLLRALEGPSLADEEVRAILIRASLEREAGSSEVLPSTEAFMHAYLLSLPDVAFVGHTHPEPLLSLLSLVDARELAAKRLFPDEVVFCGPAACYVAYADPGLPLAVKVRDQVAAYRKEHGRTPRTIWLQNHGLICPGATPGEVLSATLMQAKAASVLLGALQTRADMRFLSSSDVARIHSRPDEHYRQRLLWGEEGQVREGLPHETAN